MTSTLTGGPTTALVMPSVKIGKTVGVPLAQSVSDKLIRAVVDTHVHLPDMFVLTFNDPEGTVVDDARITIGETIEVAGAKAGDNTSTTLIKGEVTAIEAICMDGEILSVVRGYERAHRLQRARRTRTFLNVTDSDIARQVADGVGLDVGTVDDSQTTHAFVAQVAQTDWEFLTQRAREIGFEVGVVQGRLFFRKASGEPAGGSGFGAVASAAASLAGMSNDLTFKQNLITFLPRLSAANLNTQVEVRVWDTEGARVVVGQADYASHTVEIDGKDPKQMAQSFTDGLLPTPPSPPALPPIPGLPSLDFGLPSGNSSYVVVDRPVATGQNASSAVDQVAQGLANHMASTFAEAEGDAVGDPSIQAGQQVSIKGVPAAFVGKWTVTNARHVFDATEGGYHTQFFVSGRSDRSLFSLTSGGGGAGNQRNHQQINGLVCGVITSVDDDTSKGRVKLSLPWLSPSYETDWCRVVHLAAGPKSGAMFLPEVGDEVLVGFEFGDVRRPYVLGGLVNNNSSFTTLGSAVSGGAVKVRGINSPSKNTLQFTDELRPGPPGAPYVTSAVTLGTEDGNLALAIDQVAGTVTLSCKPSPPNSNTPTGTLTIDCSGAGSVEIKAGSGGMKLESTGMLELNGQAGVKISSNLNVQVQGTMVQLN